MKVLKLQKNEQEIISKYKVLQATLDQKTKITGHKEGMYSVKNYYANTDRLEIAKLGELNVLYANEFSKSLLIPFLKGVFIYMSIFLSLYMYNDWVYDGADTSTWSFGCHLMLFCIPTLSMLISMLSSEEMKYVSYLIKKLDALPTREIVYDDYANNDPIYKAGVRLFS